MHLALAAVLCLALAKGPLDAATRMASAGDCEGAVKALATVKARPDAPSVAKLAAAARICRDKDRVVGFSLTERLAELAPANPDAALAHADSLASMDQEAEALAVVERAAKANPSDQRLAQRKAALASVAPAAGPSLPTASSPKAAPSAAGADACEGTDGDDCVALLRAAMTSKPPNYKKALAISQLLCDRGMAETCNNVGVFYTEGYVGKSRPKAMAAYERSCTLGNGRGCNELGLALVEGPLAERPRAMGAFKKSCELGYGSGCFDLGVGFEKGTGGRRDPAAARAAFEKGCALRDRDSCAGACELGARGACGK